MDEKLLASLRATVNVLFRQNIQLFASKMATERIFAELSTVMPPEAREILLKYPALCKENDEKLMIGVENVNPAVAAELDAAG